MRPIYEAASDVTDSAGFLFLASTASTRRHRLDPRRLCLLLLPTHPYHPVLRRLYSASSSSSSFSPTQTTPYDDDGCTPPGPLVPLRACHQPSVDSSSLASSSSPSHALPYQNDAQLPRGCGALLEARVEQSGGAQVGRSHRRRPLRPRLRKVPRRCWPRSDSLRGAQGTWRKGFRVDGLRWRLD